MPDLESLVLSDSESAIFQEGLRQGRLEEKARKDKARPSVGRERLYEDALKDIVRAIDAHPERLREMADIALREAQVPFVRRSRGKTRSHQVSPSTGKATG